MGFREDIYIPGYLNNFGEGMLGSEVKVVSSKLMQNI